MGGSEPIFERRVVCRGSGRDPAAPGRRTRSRTARTGKLLAGLWRAFAGRYVGGRSTPKRGPLPENAPRSWTLSRRLTESGKPEELRHFLPNPVETGSGCRPPCDQNQMYSFELATRAKQTCCLTQPSLRPVALDRFAHLATRHDSHSEGPVTDSLGDEDDTCGSEGGATLVEPAEVSSPTEAVTVRDHSGLAWPRPTLDGRARLHSQPTTALGPTTAQHLATVRRTHTLPETVDLLPAAVVRLVRTLHPSETSKCSWGPRAPLPCRS